MIEGGGIENVLYAHWGVTANEYLTLCEKAGIEKKNGSNTGF